MARFVESKGFRNRLKGGVFLSLVTIPTYLLAEGLLFRVVLTIGLTLALAELCVVSLVSFYIPDQRETSTMVAIFLALVLSIIATWYFQLAVIGGVVVVVVTTDVFAYFGGKLIGGKLAKTRPFPVVSPNKTWEGTNVGLVFGLIAAVLWVRLVMPEEAGTLLFCFLWMPPAAVAGDILESYFKRHAEIKDSNDFLVDQPIIGRIEGLLGGKGGHGGYLDRLDSCSFVLSLLYFINLLGLLG
ncbi:phosphatidate cytidylyltransferase [Candidatus Saccharibacteria bacterium]|nr:phosphatidate cytidylyltransferase [Candidatus Saccharibacteria bacterium]